MIMLTFSAAYDKIIQGENMKHIYTANILQCMHYRHEKIPGSTPRIVMDYEFDFSVGCDRELWIDDEQYHIQNGCFVIRKPGQKVYSDGKYNCYMLTLDFFNRLHSVKYSRKSATEMQAPFESDMWQVLPSVFEPRHYQDYVRIFEALLSINETDINQNPRALLLVNELLHLIVSDAYDQTMPESTVQKTPIDEICSYMKSHFAEDIQLTDLAAIAHLNKNYLVRQFRKTYGISPIAYLIKIRMDYSKKLLTESNLPVKQVASECGYHDPSFFHSYFKKTFHMSPREYRQQHKQI